MLSKEQAAKYLVVAWVKDWGMRTLLEVLCDSAGFVTEDRIAEAVKKFSFLPNHICWYIANKGHGISARRFVAVAFPHLNDALFDAKDHATRLKFGPKIERLVAGNVAISSRFTDEDLKESERVNRTTRQVKTSYSASRDAFKTNQRSAWNVCKA